MANNPIRLITTIEGGEQGYDCTLTLACAVEEDVETFRDLKAGDMCGAGELGLRAIKMIHVTPQTLDYNLGPTTETENFHADDYEFTEMLYLLINHGWELVGIDLEAHDAKAVRDLIVDLYESSNW